MTNVCGGGKREETNAHGNCSKAENFVAPRASTDCRSGGEQADKVALEKCLVLERAKQSKQVPLLFVPTKRVAPPEGSV